MSAASPTDELVRQDHLDRFVRMARSPFRFRLFLLWKLPAAFFAGVRVSAISEEATRVSIRYTWFSQNPFKSTYFACLAMAAEMSSGLLCQLQISACGKPVSMLVTSLEARYFKKARGKTVFMCSDGAEIARLVRSAIETGTPQTIRTRALGEDDQGNQVAEFFITWSFRLRRPSDRST